MKNHILASALLGAAFQPGLAHPADVTWQSAVSGNWEDGSNWSSGVAPGAADRVIIDRPLAAPTITHGTGNDTVQRLSNNEVLIINGGSSIRTSDALGIGNQALGTLRVTGAGSFLGNSGDYADFVNANLVEVLNGGALMMESGASGLLAIINSGSMLFSGTGSIGSFRSLGGTFTEKNTGSMTVQNGATLTLEGGPWTGGGLISNLGGTLNIKAMEDSFAQVVNTSGAGAITNLTAVAGTASVPTLPLGATVKVGNGGVVNITGGGASAALFLDVATGGTVNVLGGNTLQLAAKNVSHVNNGLINIKGGSLTDAVLQFVGSDGTANLTGSGTVTLAKGLFGDGRIKASLHELNNGAGHTIQGVGTIEAGLPVNNYGNLVAQAGGDLEVDLSLGLRNRAGGTIRATGAGSRFVYTREEGVFTNNGLVEASGGGQVVIAPENAVTLPGVVAINIASGSTVRATGAGSEVRLAANGLAPDAGKDPEVVTLNGTVEAQSGGVVRIEGKLSNLSSGGTLLGGTYRVIGKAGLDTEIRLQGAIENNGATIQLRGPQARIINSDTGLSALFGMSSNTLFGRLTVEDGANFTSSGNFSNSGVVSIGKGSTFASRAILLPSQPLRDYSQNLGLTTVNGTLRADDVLISGGTLRGGGLIEADVVMLGGTLAPGNSPGVLSIDGDYTQGTGATLAMELGGFLPGFEYDVLDVSGIANLAGALEVDLLPGFDPAVDAYFDLLLAEDILGEFDSVELPTSSLGTFSLTYVREAFGLDAVRLLFDAAGSGGGDDPPPPDDDDLPPPGGTVPEPSTLALLLAVAAALRARSRGGRAAP